MLPRPVVIVGSLVWAGLAVWVAHASRIPIHVSAISVFGIGVILNAANVYMTMRYIEIRSPEMATEDLWFATAGLGVVPRWVSAIGIVGEAGLLGSVVPYASWVASGFGLAGLVRFVVFVALYAVSYFVIGVLANFVAMQWMRARWRQHD